jgi:hypothetical protein
MCGINCVAARLAVPNNTPASVAEVSSETSFFSVGRQFICRHFIFTKTIFWSGALPPDIALGIVSGHLTRHPYFIAGCPEIYFTS